MTQKDFSGNIGLESVQAGQLYYGGDLDPVL